MHINCPKICFIDIIFQISTPSLILNKNKVHWYYLWISPFINRANSAYWLLIEKLNNLGFRFNFKFWYKFHQMTFSHTYINIQRKSNYKIDLRSITEETRITLKMYKIAWLLLIARKVTHLQQDSVAVTNEGA